METPNKSEAVEGTFNREAETSEHKALVREEFTRQADAYASAPVITDAERLARLVGAADPGPDDRALDISRPAPATSRWRSRSDVAKLLGST